MVFAMNSRLALNALVEDRVKEGFEIRGDWARHARTSLINEIGRTPYWFQVLFALEKNVEYKTIADPERKKHEDFLDVENGKSLGLFIYGEGRAIPEIHIGEFHDYPTLWHEIIHFFDHELGLTDMKAYPPASPLHKQFRRSAIGVLQDGERYDQFSRYALIPSQKMLREALSYKAVEDLERDKKTRNVPAEALAIVMEKMLCAYTSGMHEDTLDDYMYRCHPIIWPFVKQDFLPQMVERARQLSPDSILDGPAF